LKRRDFVLAAAGVLAGCSTPGVKLDVPYVSTPEPVVREMLRMAAVRPGDMVYDLGCGDGRIVIAAARDFGARGVGIDIDPRRIAEANAAARSAGVEGRVRFAVQDLFKTDFSDASVVALYLFEELNAKLLPKFRAELKPGTRIVSHRFGIGDWKPHASAVISANGDDHWVYLWVVP
jgi:cyclopropane fatty-acyl-phospholipid synthase-like methyltransferase